MNLRGGRTERAQPGEQIVVAIVNWVTFALTEPGVTAGSGREAWAIAADVVSTTAKAAASCIFIA